MMEMKDFKQVAVIGAGGKMGSGIALLMARLMTQLSVQKEISTKELRLVFVDMSSDSLEGLKGYLKKQLDKFADKNPDLGGEFTERAFEFMCFETSVEKVEGCAFVFEAIVENISIKIDLYKKLKSLCTEKACFFTNTSSIPISILNTQADLENRVVGFHFYNPPAIQKLLELITTDDTDKDLVQFAELLGNKLGKIVIHAKDIAGFIGNGHFIRDYLFAEELVKDLEDDWSMPQAIYLVNRLTQDYLIRPMGIFQLLDYVGLDVYSNICAVMTEHIDSEDFFSSIIDKMIAEGRIGGQFSDGSQKDGFFSYESGKPVATYCLSKKEYVPFSALNEGKCEAFLGALPEENITWKSVMKHPDRKVVLKEYFSKLFDGDHMGCLLAKKYLLRSKEIAEVLVRQGVANSLEDVNAVLKHGFYHAYGPHNGLF